MGTSKLDSIRRIVYSVYLPLTIAFLLLSSLYPIDPSTVARRHLTISQARWLSLSVAIPQVIIWLIAIYGAWRFADYSQSIKKDKDGAAFSKLALGLQLIALYMPLRALLRLLLHILTSHQPNLASFSNILVTYFNLLFLLVTLLIISDATRELILLVRFKLSLKAYYLFALLYISLAVSYCAAIFGHPNSIGLNNWLVNSPQNIPLPIRTITITIPYLFMWFIGLYSGCAIYLYHRHVKGVVYRQAIRLLAIGLIGVVMATVILQFVTTIAANLRNLPLSAILAMVYGLLLLLGLAFMAIIQGVNRFKQL